jgi:hypothetical protein
VSELVIASCVKLILAIVLRDSKKAAEIDEDLAEQEDYHPRTRAEQEAHTALMAAKAQEKKE